MKGLLAPTPAPFPENHSDATPPGRTPPAQGRRTTSDDTLNKPAASRPGVPKRVSPTGHTPIPEGGPAYPSEDVQSRRYRNLGVGGTHFTFGIGYTHQNEFRQPSERSQCNLCLCGSTLLNKLRSVDPFVKRWPFAGLRVFHLHFDGFTVGVIGGIGR